MYICTYTPKVQKQMPETNDQDLSAKWKQFATVKQQEYNVPALAVHRI